MTASELLRDTGPFGSGGRVEKSTGTLYWYGPGGTILAETDLSGNALNEYVYFAGARRCTNIITCYYIATGRDCKVDGGTRTDASVV
jgi:hypothetical protein